MDPQFRKNSIVNAINNEIDRLNDCLDKNYIFDRTQIDGLMRLADILNDVNSSEMLYGDVDKEIAAKIDTLIERYKFITNPENQAEHH